MKCLQYNKVSPVCEFEQNVSEVLKIVFNYKHLGFRNFVYMYRVNSNINFNLSESFNKT